MHSRTPLNTQYLLIFSGVVYPAWYFLLQWIDPTVNETFTPRLIVGLIFLTTSLVVSRSDNWKKRHSELLNICLLILMAHYFQVIASNNLKSTLVVGSFIITCCVCIIPTDKRWNILIASATILMAGITCLLAESNIHEKVYFIMSVLTVVAVIQIVQFDRLHNLKLLEQNSTALVESAKMAALGEMASGIAHEINNPLAIIQMCNRQITRSVTNASESKTPLDLEQVLKTTKNVESTIDRIAKIINGLRTFSRNDSVDKLVTVSAKSIVDETLSFCQSSLQNLSIDVSVHSIDDSLKVKCHSTQISQVLLNLIQNSRDAIENCEKKTIRIQVVEEGKFISFKVFDSGPGVPSDVQKKIMNPFFTTKEVGKGTGLGLSISKGIAERHNGSLFLDTKSQQTCFVLKIPSARFST